MRRIIRVLSLLLSAVGILLMGCSMVGFVDFDFRPFLLAKTKHDILAYGTPLWFGFGGIILTIVSYSCFLFLKPRAK